MDYKTLKFDHEFAKLIRLGKRTCTWRIGNDKNIHVNDVIYLIDKVDPRAKDTWKVFGTAKVTQIIEKRLSDIDESDLKSHVGFKTHKQLLKMYREYYGSDVKYTTPINIINFVFTPLQTEEIYEEDTIPTTVIDAKIYADGGSRGNPGPSASGFVILDMEDRIIVQKGVYLGVTTNNQAEYNSLKLSLQEALELGVKRVSVFMDSLLVINQMLGRFKVKNKDLCPVYDAVKLLSRQFDKISFTHVPRELNKLADRQVNIALDEHSNK